MYGQADTAAFGTARRYVMEQLNVTSATFYYGNGKEAVVARQLVAYALHHYAGWAYTDIADMLRCQVSTVSRGVAKIKSLSDVPEVTALCRELHRALLHVDVDISTVESTDS